MEPLAALRENFAVHITDPLVGMPGARARSSAEIVIGDSGTECDTFNMIAGARLGDDPSAAIAAAIQGYGGRPFSWWLTSGDTPADLSRYLTAAGLREAETEAAMAAPLGGKPGSDDTLVIRVVRTPEDLSRYAGINARNWDPPDHRVISFFAAAAPRLLRPGSPFIYLLGLAPDGTPVATGEGCFSATSLGLYGISVRKEWRGRGYGTAISRRLLAEGVRRGARLAVLQASADGIRVYRKLGFETIGTITEFKPVT